MPCGVLESESHVSSRDLKRKLKKKGSTPSPRLFDHIEDNIPEDTVLNK
jgi:hypothetical protein